MLRERCSEELGQKDAEIFSLKARLEAPPATPPEIQTAQGATSPALGSIKQVESAPTFAELLRQDQSISDIVASQTRDQDLAFLSSQVESLKEVVAEYEKHEEQTKSQVQLLKEQIKRLETNIRRETHNLEYLKNLVVKFLECDIKKARQMLPAIFTVLEFSAEEKKKIEAVWQNAGTWGFF